MMWCFEEEIDIGKRDVSEWGVGVLHVVLSTVLQLPGLKVAGRVKHLCAGVVSLAIHSPRPGRCCCAWWMMLRWSLHAGAQGQEAGPLSCEDQSFGLSATCPCLHIRLTCSNSATAMWHRSGLAAVHGKDERHYWRKGPERELEDYCMLWKVETGSL